MEKTRQDLVLGLVFFASLGILMWATVQLTGLTILGETETRTVMLRSAGGLEEGDNVFVAGRRIGSVAKLEYRPRTDPDERIVATIVLDEPVDLTDAYSVRVAQGSPLGGMELQIEPGLGPSVVPPTQPLRGELVSNGLDAVGDLFGDEGIKEDVRGILRGVREAVDRLNAGESTLGKLFAEPALYDETLAAVESLRSTLDAIARGESVFGRLAHDRSLGDRTVEIVDDLGQVADNLAGIDGLVPRLINDSELGEQGGRIVGDVAALTGDLRAGKGAAGALLADAAVADDLRRITAGFADLAEMATDPTRGAIGELIAGAEMREHLSNFVADLVDMSSSVRESRGLLGRIIYDEELGEQFTRMLSQVSRAIEDAREAAPIGSFFQVVTGAF